MEKIRTREEQRIEDTWDLEAIYPTEEAWEEDARLLEEGIAAFSRQKETAFDSGKALLQMLEEYCELGMRLGKVYVYASMRLDEDTSKSSSQEKEGRARLLAVKMDTACAWVEPGLQKLGQDTLEQFMEQEDGLKLYRVFLEEILRRQQHTLPEEQELLLAGAGELGSAPQQVYMMFQNADLTFPAVQDENGQEHPLTQETFVPLQQNASRQVRRQAFENLYGTYARFGNTLAALYDANLRQALFFARERHYGSSLEAALDGSQIPVQVYHQLIDTVHANLPVMHRYTRLRRRLLGLEQLHMYDVYMPLVSEVEKEYSFQEAKEIVLEGLRPLGEEYCALLKRGMESRWIDVYENKGKRGGAYSSGSYGTLPYVLLNYQGSLTHVFTLAHEMGHSLHSYYTRESQPYIYGDYRIFVAEVASTCNEALLIRSLLEKTTEKKERLFLINYLLEQFKSTLIRQTMFAEFELITHSQVQEGKTLNARSLCEIYGNLNREYFGDAMESDEGISWEWARIPHFYRPFYVYQYATGFSAAIAISEKIWKKEPGAVENYQKFLRCGSSLSPLEALKLCGVDMTRPEPVQDALHMFEEYLELMERETER